MKFLILFILGFIAFHFIKRLLQPKPQQPSSPPPIRTVGDESVNKDHAHRSTQSSDHKK